MSNRHRASLSAAALSAAMMVSLVAGCGTSRPAALDLTSQPAAIADRYHFIASHQDLAEQVVCYCGCGRTLEHRQLRDCFVRDDGTFDPHGAGCGICLAEAQRVTELSAQGLTADVIAARIDESFSTVGPPTQQH